MTIEIDKCYNMDCNVGMKLMQEQGLIADWCITDVPYGIGAVMDRVKSNGTQYGKAQAKKGVYEMKAWDDTRLGGAR